MTHAMRMDPAYQGLIAMSRSMTELLDHTSFVREAPIGPATFSLERSTLGRGAGAYSPEAFRDVFAQFTSRYPPDQIIRHGQAVHYERWFLLPRERGAPRLYLHRYLGDDPGDLGLHDHPWFSASLLLAGSLVEHWRPYGASSTTHRDVIPPFTVILRPPQLAHRLTIGEGDPVTLFATGPHLREWGFWRQDRRGFPAWTYWRDAA